MHRILLVILISLVFVSCSTVEMGPVQSTENQKIIRGQLVKDIVITYGELIYETKSNAMANKIDTRLNRYLESELQARSLIDSETGQLTLEILITDVWVKSGFSNAMLGPITGKDRLATLVSIKDANTGQLIKKYPVTAKHVSKTSFTGTSARRSDNLAKSTAVLIADSIHGTQLN